MIKSIALGALIASVIALNSTALALTQAQKGKISFAAVCTAFADEGNKMLKAKGVTGSFDVISAAAADDMKGVRTLPGAMDAYNGFYEAAIKELAGSSEVVKPVMFTQTIGGCVKIYKIQ